MRGLLLSAALCLTPVAASAAIGDSCDDGVCGPGEVCIPDAEGTYCTTRCPAGGCPEGYRCEDADGVAELCVHGEPPPPPVGLGEACESSNDCEVGLFCAQDDDVRFCSRACTVPGSCPEGYRCQGRMTPTCVPEDGLPGMGEPCAGGTDCAESLVCGQAPVRTLPFCTIECTGECPDGWTCDGGQCVPRAADRPATGERCVPDDAVEPALAGCAQGYCLAAGANPYCTRPCDALDRCPAGMGCVDVDPSADKGECRRGAEDDPVFSTPDNPPPPPPPSGDGGAVTGDGGVAPPGADAAAAGSGGGADEGCACDAGGGLAPTWALLAFVALIGLIRARGNRGGALEARTLSGGCARSAARPPRGPTRRCPSRTRGWRRPG